MLIGGKEEGEGAIELGLMVILLMIEREEESV
jgi:hypothetical protein